MKNVKNVSWALLYMFISMVSTVVFEELFNIEDMLVRFLTWIFFIGFTTIWVLIGIEMYKDLNDE